MYWDGEKSRFGDFDKYEHFVVGMPSLCNVCMYVCMYVYIYVCMYVCTDVNSYTESAQYSTVFRHRLVIGEFENKSSKIKAPCDTLENT
jgi:hypothetical protein